MNIHQKRDLLRSMEKAGINTGFTMTEIASLRVAQADSALAASSSHWNSLPKDLRDFASNRNNSKEDVQRFANLLVKSTAQAGEDVNISKRESIAYPDPDQEKGASQSGATVTIDVNGISHSFSVSHREATEIALKILGLSA